MLLKLFPTFWKILGFPVHPGCRNSYIHSFVIQYLYVNPRLKRSTANVQIHMYSACVWNIVYSEGAQSLHHQTPHTQDPSKTRKKDARATSWPTYFKLIYQNIKLYLTFSWKNVYTTASRSQSPILGSPGNKDETLVTG